MQAKAGTSKEELKGLIALANELDLDPVQDVDLMWIAEEYHSAELPDGWSKVKAPTGNYQYYNAPQNLTVTNNPIKPRFRKMVSLIKHCQRKNLVVDEVTLLELWTPISKIDDIIEMATYLNMNPIDEPHMMWIPKLAILEGLPEGWKETKQADGSVLYVNADEGKTSVEHPLDQYFLKLVEHVRKQSKPKESLGSDLYEWQPEVEFDSSDFEPEEKWFHRRVTKVPAAGKYMSYYDAYGQTIWYDLSTQKKASDMHEVKLLGAVLAMQRFWKSYKVRQQLWNFHNAACVIGKHWKKYKFKKVLENIHKERVASAKFLQRWVRNMKLRYESSKSVFMRLGSIGTRPGRKSVQNVSGLLATGHSFFHVRRKVILIQRTFRSYRAKRLRPKRRNRNLRAKQNAPPPTGAPIPPPS